MICEANSPYLFDPAQETKINHLIALEILQKSGHLEYVDSLIEIQMKKHLVSLPHILEEKAREKWQDEDINGDVAELVKIYKKEQDKLQEL